MQKYFKNHINKIMTYLTAYYQGQPEEVCNKPELKAKDLKYYPEFLYKYRSCNKNSFESLEQDYIWADYPSSFDDPIDAKIRLDSDQERKNLEELAVKYFWESIHHKIYTELRGGEINHSLGDKRQLLDADGNLDSLKMLEALNPEFAKLPQEKKKELVSGCNKAIYEKWKSDFFQRQMGAIADFLRKSIMLACLTKRKDNQKMWEDYADKYKGFVIEYRRPLFEEMSTEQREICFWMFPVEYRSKVPNFDLRPIIEFYLQREYYGRAINITSEWVDLFCQMLYKKIEYSGEEEWRLFSGSKDHKMRFPFASAVYAGRGIEKQDLERLEKICRKKTIPLYKQEYDAFGNMHFILCKGT